jgi:hypothetical protein
MRQAYANLTATEPAAATAVKPTHLSLRFKPANTDQLADLSDLGYRPSWEPMDESVAATTVVNRDTDEIPWIYTVVPVGTALPTAIPYEQLQELYLFTTEDGDTQDADPWEPDPMPPTDACAPQWDPSCQCYVTNVQYQPRAEQRITGTRVGAACHYLSLVSILTARLLLSVSLLFALSSCGKKEPYPELVSVGFLPSATITPSSRTIHRGDTLWVEADFSDSLLDYHSGKRYRVRPQDLKLNSFLVYRELLGVGQVPAGIAPTFRLVEKVGHASIDGAFTGSFDLVYDGSYYRAKIGLIPTKSCITSLILSIVPAGERDQLLPFIQPPSDAQGREQRAQLDDSYYSINGGKANNFDLFQRYYKTFSQDPSAPLKTAIYEQQSTFTVEVN